MLPERYHIHLVERCLQIIVLILQILILEQELQQYQQLTNPEEDTSFKVFEMDKEGNVVLWNPEGFVQLCEQSEDPALKAMLAIYNLGIIEGCRAE